MKYLIISCTVLTTLIAFSSCKRNYTCECYSPSLNKSVTYEIKEYDEDVAYARCKEQNVTGTASDYTCFIK